MQRKLLNVYLYHDDKSATQQFKMRLIEMQTVEVFPPDMDKTMLEKFAGIETPFAVCLSDELDKYNPVPTNISDRESKESGTLFNSLRNGYTREIIRDGEECYIYQDIDLLLFAEAGSSAGRSYKGNDHDLLQTLAALDDAVTAFRKNAVHDKYEVGVNITKSLPDFSKKLDILRDAFNGVTTEPVNSVSRHAINWLIHTIHGHGIVDRLKPSTVKMADDTLSPLLIASEESESLNIAIRSKLSIVNPGGVDTPRPLRSSLFAENLAHSKRDIALVEAAVTSLKIN